MREKTHTAPPPPPPSRHHHYKEQKRRQQSDMGLLTELSNPAIFSSSSSFLTFPMSLLPIGSCFLVHQRKNSWLPERKKGKKRSRTRERERERFFFLFIFNQTLSPLSLPERERESGRIKYGRLSISSSSFLLPDGLSRDGTRRNNTHTVCNTQFKSTWPT